MTFFDAFILLGMFIAMMLIYRFADRFVKKMRPRTIKTMNWIGFGIGAVGGIAWYALSWPIFMFVTMLGIIMYFIFYNYEEEEAK